MVTNEGSIACKCFKKKNVREYSNIAYFAHIWNISNIAWDKKSLRFNLSFTSKFKFDRVHGKMLKDTHLKVI